MKSKLYYYNVVKYSQYILITTVHRYKSCIILLMLSVISEGDGDAMTGSCTVSINVQDVNDVIPQCTLSTNVHIYPEDVDISNTNIVDMSTACSDPEVSPNGDLSYTLTSVNGAAGTGDFALGSSTGVLTFAVQPDFETTTEYVMRVTVTDGGSVSLSTTVDITVTITDVNEYSPDFTGQQSADSVSEAIAVGATIITIVATDGDTADTLTYSLNTPSNTFSIDSSTGEVFTIMALDRETQDTYSLDIVATDDNPVNTQHSTIHSLTITVTDVNDITPYFDPASYVASVSESTSIGDTVTAVTANDEDNASDGIITYSITSVSNPGTSFQVDGSTGIITVLNTLDYETTSSYNLEVLATDGGGSVGTAIVNVAVDSYNEFIPTFSPAAPTFDVDETLAVGNSIGVVAATDSDSGDDGVFTYVITSGDDGTFSVDPSTGDITLIASLDYETRTSYSLTVEAADNGVDPSAKTGQATVIVNINDMNDNGPVCSPTTYATTIAEDSTAGNAVITVTCTDGDVTTAFSDLIYTIDLGNDDGHFDIGTSSGKSRHVNLISINGKVSLRTIYYQNQHIHI